MLRKIVSQTVFLVVILVFVSACQSKLNTTTPTPSPTPTAPFNFIDSGQNLGQGDGVSVVVGDVDGDGDNDALISNSDKNSTLMLNDGAGNFTPSDQEFLPSTGASLGDLNGDKNLDIFITQETSNEVWLNDGKGWLRFFGDGYPIARPDIPVEPVLV